LADSVRNQLPLTTSLYLLCHECITLQIKLPIEALAIVGRSRSSAVLMQLATVTSAAGDGARVVRDVIVQPLSRHGRVLEAEDCVGLWESESSFSVSNHHGHGLPRCVRLMGKSSDSCKPRNSLDNSNSKVPELKHLIYTTCM